MSMDAFVARNEQVDPPDPEQECAWCDGHKLVLLVAINDAEGTIQQVTCNRRNYTEVTCPRCQGSGDEPEIDPFDDPRL
jgi:DnaJ-class molecular chaperone|tara:strand:+ start:818 stop:1054 length:237 start_codon:yes stop_codon:yes gene_type:complete